MSHVSVTGLKTSFDKLDYRGSYLYDFGGGEEFLVPPMVAVKFKACDLMMTLDIEDAEALLYALGTALVEHAVALKDPSIPKLVAR